MRCIFQNFLLPYLVFSLKFTELLALDPGHPASDGDRTDLKNLRQVQVVSHLEPIFYRFRFILCAVTYFNLDVRSSDMGTAAPT